MVSDLLYPKLITFFHLPLCVNTFIPTLIFSIGICPLSVNINVPLGKQGLPKEIMSTGSISDPSIFLISPRCLTSGRFFFV